VAIAISQGADKDRIMPARLATGSQAMVAEQWDDQNPEGVRSVPRFFAEFVS